MGGHLKAFGLFVWRNLDASFVIVVGLVVAALEIVGHPSEEAVNAAILGLLAVTAIILLRIRGRKGELDEVIQVARDAMSERPFQMVWAKNEWDIQSRERATIKVRQQLRFIHNKVSTIDHWSQGDGAIESYDACWRRSEADGWVPAKKIYAMPIEGGEKVIYSFEEENCRGDILEWKVEREATDRFPTAHEKVSLEAIARSDHPREMRVVWPADAPPSRVELRQGGNPGRPLTTKTKNDRVEVAEQIPQLALGEVVEIRWMW
ncbi:MAG: hypothetical protein QM729_16835 [Solirubrobacterales bacterium]